ncbi:MAG: DUF4124 domain-containing protein [Proteobacteria bacterium]|nr:DUF4124 domain-containing protein [Pseudomonadota bacterium]
MRDHPFTASRRLRHAVILAGVAAFALLTTAVFATGAPTPAASPVANPAKPSPTQANVVYKWKDAHGVSQYSQDPPPKGVKFETIERSGTTAGDHAAASPTSSPPKSSGNGF